MDKAVIGQQNLIDALTPVKETLTVTSHVATMTNPIGALLFVEATVGSVTGPCGIRLSGTVATKQVKFDRTAKTLTFYASDAVTQCYVEYLEGLV